MCLASVLCPLRCSTLGVLPLGHPGANLTPWRPVSRRHVLLFPICAHDELTPPICRPPPGPHAGSSLAEGTPAAVFLCPGICGPPSFGDIIEPFDTSAVVYTCSSSRRAPDPLIANRFRNRFPPQLLTDMTLRRFGTSACTATPEDLPPSQIAHGSIWLPFRRSADRYLGNYRPGVRSA